MAAGLIYNDFWNHRIGHLEFSNCWEFFPRQMSSIKLENFSEYIHTDKFMEISVVFMLTAKWLRSVLFLLFPAIIYKLSLWTYFLQLSELETQWKQQTKTSLKQPKCQLNSEWIYEVIVSPKMLTKNKFKNVCPTMPYPLTNFQGRNP